MGDNINVDWGLAQDQAATTGSMGQTAQQGALAGYELGQKQASIHALQGYDGSPQSTAAATDASVRAANLDQAEALQKLSISRYKAGILTGSSGADPLAPYLSNPTGGTPPAASPAAPAGPPAPTPGNFQFDPHNTLNIMRLAQNATGDLMSVPLVDRPAEAQQVKADMMKRGVPEPAIDAAMADLSDAGLKSLHDHYGAVVDHMNTVLNGPKTPNPDEPAPPPNPDGSPADVKVTAGGLPKHVNPYPAAPPQAAGGGAPASGGVPTGAGAQTPFAQASAALVPGADNPALRHPSNDWQHDLLGDRGALARMGILKSMGIDYSPVLEAAKIAETPTIQKQADLAYNPAIGVATEQAKNAAGLGQTTLHMANGSTMDVTPGQAQALMAAAPGMFRTQTPGEAVSQTEAAKAPYEMVTAPIGGRPTTMFKNQAMGASAAGMPGFGVGLTPGEATSQAGDASNLQDYVKKAPAQNQALQQEQINGQKIAALAKAVPTGKYADKLADLSSTLTLPGKTSDLATNTGMLTQALASSFKDSLGGMAIPRLASEGNAITSAIPKIGSQQDQIGLYGAGLTAAANYAKRQNDFIVDYANKNPQNPSLAAAQSAWEHGPGMGSFMADPAFKGYKMSNGQPAVITTPDGKWGVFLPGTKQAFKFRAGQ